MVITGVAGQIPDRIDELVYLDAVVPSFGQSFVDVYPPALDMFLATGANNRGLYIDPFPAAQFGGNESDRAVIDRLGVPFPLAATTERLPLSGVDLAGFKRTYILATGYENPYSDNRERLEGDRRGTSTPSTAVTTSCSTNRGSSWTRCCGTHSRALPP